MSFVLRRRMLGIAAGKLKWQRGPSQQGVWHKQFTQNPSEYVLTLKGTTVTTVTFDRAKVDSEIVKLGLSPASTSVAYLLAPSPLPEIRAKYARPGCPPAFFREPAGWFAADKSHSRAKEFITSFTGNLPKYFR